MRATREGDKLAVMTYEKLLERYPEQVRVLGSAARAFIRRTLPKTEESLDESAGVAGYGPGPGYSGLICTPLLSKSGVKLGLAHGATLADPDALLEGSGKVHRYLQLRAVADLKRPGVARLLKAALEAWKFRAG